MRRLADEHRLGREKDLLQLELCWLDQLGTYINLEVQGLGVLGIFAVLALCFS